MHRFPAAVFGVANVDITGTIKRKEVPKVTKWRSPCERSPFVTNASVLHVGSFKAKFTSKPHRSCLHHSPE